MIWVAAIGKELLAFAKTKVGQAAFVLLALLLLGQYIHHAGYVSGKAAIQRKWDGAEQDRKAEQAKVDLQASAIEKGKASEILSRLSESERQRTALEARLSEQLRQFKERPHDKNDCAYSPADVERVRSFRR